MEKLYKSIDGNIIECSEDEVQTILQNREIALQKTEADRIAREENILQEKSRKDSAIAKLKALGLTEEEAQAIIK
jgi:hypothetical protein